MSQKTTRIIALIALLCIVISVIGTGILFIFTSGNGNQNTELTPEELEQLQWLIENQSGQTMSGEIIDDPTSNEIIESNIDETGTGIQE